MKKILMTMILGVLLVPLAPAQLTDTVQHRVGNYYYWHWYDTCQCEGLYRGTETNLAKLRLLYHTQYQWGEYARRDFTPSPLDLLGMAVMVIPEVNTHEYLDSNYGEEYVYVAYYDSENNQMVKVDSARWDTVQPKTMRLVLTSTPEHYFWNYEHPGGVAYCRVYEAYFEKPVRVEGEFYVIGSFHGSVHCEDPGWTGFCMHKPVYYASVGGPAHGECCFPRGASFTRVSRGGGVWQATPGYYTSDGPFLPIIESQYLLEVRSADTTMGHVTGGGFYPDSTGVRIEAVPEYGYVFSHWNDGDTANPRLVTVTGDTVFTAYYSEEEYYRMSVSADPPEYGTVEGGGIYPQNTDTVIEARPLDGRYRFVEWNDSVVDNPRRVRVVCDTAFTAIFVSREAIEEAEAGAAGFELLPNPASDEVRIMTEGEGFEGGTLAVSDAAGREVLRRELARGMRTCTLKVSDLPSGTYFVTLTTAKGTSTRKLIIEN